MLGEIIFSFRMVPHYGTVSNVIQSWRDACVAVTLSL